MLAQRKTSCILQIPKLCYQSIKYLSVSVCPLSTLVYLIFFIVIVCLDLDLSPWPKIKDDLCCKHMACEVVLRFFLRLN